MRMRRLLIGVVAVSVLSTILTVTYVALGPLRAAPPAPQATAAVLSGPEWSTAWAAAPSSGFRNGPPGHTVRNVVHTTVGGPKVRVRLTNRFGAGPLLLGHVTVAVSAHAGGRRDGSVDASDGGAAPGTLRDVLFNGIKRVSVPAGADVLSDPVALDVPADTDLLVTVWTPVRPPLSTWHVNGRQVSFVSPAAMDVAADPTSEPFTARTTAWFYVAGVDVAGAAGTVVAFGDSITDGSATVRGGNHRWPDLLAARLAAGPEPDYGVANVGIGGNRLLLDAGHPYTRIASRAGRSGQSRFAGDVLEQSGARAVIILFGINDIMQQPRQGDPARIRAGLAHLAARARAHGLRVVVGTLTPFHGWRAWSPALDRVRVRVNDWIRAGGGGAFDGMADFDRAVRDPGEPRRLRADFDGGDHLHPNDAGMQAMANAVPLDKL